MMQFFKQVYFLGIAVWLGTVAGMAQSNGRETPYSSREYFQKVLNTQENELETIILPELDPKEIEKDAQKNLSGKGIAVAYTLTDEGQWLDLPGGDRLWRLKVKSEGAKSMYVLSDNFYLPEGAELFIYNEKKTKVLGAFTSEDNKPDKRFSTTTIKGDCIVLEYYEPVGVKGQGRLDISHIGHIYQNFHFDKKETSDRVKEYATFDFEDSESCNIDINCTEGDDWQKEKRGIARILMFFQGGSAGWCSGALINNTNNNGSKLYFLTAYHCQDAGNPLYSQWRFDFDYELSSCRNSTGEPDGKSTQGCTQRILGKDSDFLLVELDALPDGYVPYFLGWDRSGTKPSSGVGIHHPSGDVKKLSVAASNTVLSKTGLVFEGGEVFPDHSHWGVDPWNAGGTEGGSSGSPLLDQDGRIVGQLHGGIGDCSSPASNSSFYGKLSYTWNNSSIDSFLDPAGTGQSTLNAYDPNNALTDNVGVTKIESVIDGCAFTEDTQIKITVRNLGTETQTSFPVFYQVKDENGNEVQALTQVDFNGFLDSDATTEFEFTVDLSGNGSYELEAYTELTGDLNTGDDTHTTTLINNTPTVGSTGITFSNQEDFIMDIAWFAGNGEQRIVLVKEGSAFTENDLPVDGNSYEAFSQYASVTPVGDAFPVYKGVGETVKVTGLDVEKTYFVAVVEYSCTPPTYLLTNVPAASNVVTSIEAPLSAKEVKVVPNPAAQNFKIELNTTNYKRVSAYLYNRLGELVGEKVLDRKTGAYQALFDVKNLSKGAYILKIKTEDEVMTQKVIVY